MEIYTSEKEQLEQIRDWFKKYGMSIVLGVAIAFVITFGWRFWQQRQVTLGQQASQLYEQLLAVQSTQAKAPNPQVAQIANELMLNYNGTPYAGLAALMLASDAVQQGQLDLAEQKLQWVVANARTKPMEQIAKIRAARVLIAQNKSQQALQLLNKISDQAYIAEIDAVKGDAYAALGKTADAQAAYQSALDAMPKDAALRPLVQMKLANL